MNKLFIPLLLAMGLGSLIGCSSELDSPRSDRAVYTTPDVSSMPRLQRYIERLFAKQYNVNITYTWDQKATDSRFLLAPITEAKALEYLNLIDYAFFQVYAVAAPEGYLQTHTVKSLNLFGSSGYGMDRRMLGSGSTRLMSWMYLTFRRRVMTTLVRFIMSQHIRFTKSEPILPSSIVSQR